MQEPKITEELILEHGLTLEEYELIKDILKREPNYTELGIFSVMWSEHCSYKNSKPLLKMFPTKGKNILIGAGEENAGVVDVGDGWAIVFKIESHNHPSAIEPYQGAATGIGGIIRDIFTMGARPIACMDSLRFGRLSQPRVQQLLKGVVEGIAGYGNCIGIPTIGGEISFDETYETNPLVNVYCLGVVKHEDIARGAAKGIGNSIYYVGATTGRDGIHGATFASDDLTQESEEKRSAVQVGDPFLEKLLLEACLELLQTDYVVGIQDMGAAGLTCSTCETASRGNSGVEIDVDLVPKRETGMTPYETMLSESQERMLIVVKKGKEKQVEEIFEKWDLHAVKIGEVIEGENMRVLDKGKLVVEIPAKKLADDAPIYNREFKKPEYLEKVKHIDKSKMDILTDYSDSLLRLLASPNIASKSWVYEQYDHMVRTNTVVMPGSDGAVLRIKEAEKAVAMSLDGNGRYCYLDPYEGGKIVIAESARNVVCSGGNPVASTDCLNFGNPMNPEVFWQMKECVKGMAEACEKLGTPVIGGNVSLYNQNPKGAIFPTPIVGVVGLIDYKGEKLEDKINTQWFENKDDVIILLGENKDEIGASEFLNVLFNEKQGEVPKVDLDFELNLYKVILKATDGNLFSSCHDCSDGGLAVALAESCISNKAKQIGAEINLDENISVNSLLFGETQSRVVVSCKKENADKILDICKEFNFPGKVIGKTGGNSLKINDKINVELKDMDKAFNSLMDEVIK
jgi:phosphoribosylformylglycinamidine synthase subunit PurL